MYTDQERVERVDYIRYLAGEIRRESRAWEAAEEPTTAALLYARALHLAHIGNELQESGVQCSRRE